jgi:hypothetical protein
MSSDRRESISCERKYIDGTFKKLVGAFVKASFYHCVIGAADDVAVGRMRMLTRARSCVALVDRVDLATPLSLGLGKGREATLGWADARPRPKPANRRRPYGSGRNVEAEAALRAATGIDPAFAGGLVQSGRPTRRSGAVRGRRRMFTQKPTGSA